MGYIDTTARILVTLEDTQRFAVVYLDFDGKNGFLV
jgi:hypothetical protein